MIAAIDLRYEISDLEEETRAAFQTTWTKEQQPEILALIRTYSTFSVDASVARLAAEPFTAQFLDEG